MCRLRSIKIDRVASVQFYVKKSYCFQQNAFVEKKCLYWTLFASEVAQTWIYWKVTERIRQNDTRLSFAQICSSRNAVHWALTLKRRLHTWFQFAPVSIVWEWKFFSVSTRRFRGFTALRFCLTHKIRRYWLLALSTNLAENFDSCLRSVFVFVCSLFVSLMKY